MPTEPTYHNNLGLSYFEKGLFNDALASYEEAIKMENLKIILILLISFLFE